MKIAIIGAGGLGSKYGAYLGALADVWLLHHRQDYVDAVNQNGLQLVVGEEKRTVACRATTDARDLAGTDVAIVTVKSYDTRQAMEALAPYLKRDGVAITLQNGLGNLETMAEVLGPDRAVLGVTMNGATLLGPGIVADKGKGATYLAVRPEVEGRLQQLADLLNQAGLPTELSGEVQGLLWGKLCMVAGINPMAAVLRVSNDAMGMVESARNLSHALIREMAAVASARGVQLPFDPIEQFAKTTKATTGMYSGTLLDAARGRRTEIDAIAGVAVREGERLGVETPVLRVLWQLVKAVEDTHSYRVGPNSLDAVLAGGGNRG